MKAFINIVLLAFLAILLSCSRGQGGSGFMDGEVSAPECELYDKDYHLNPTFFSAAPVVGGLEIRVQRGSDFEDFSDGLSLFVKDAAKVQAGFDQDWEVGENKEVQMTVYFNETCPSYPINRMRRPVLYSAVKGTIRFDALYAPEVSKTDLRILGHFENIRFEDQSEPETRYAIMSGSFSFLFSRGRPSQRFP